MLQNKHLIVSLVVLWPISSFLEHGSGASIAFYNVHL
nr:expressed protein [Hymenolepis microstoma]